MGGAIVSLPEQALAGGQTAKAQTQSWIKDNWGLALGLAVFLIVLVLPAPSGLSVAGQRMLAIFGFAVVVWITEALDYAVSAVVIAALMAFFLGISPSMTNPAVPIGSVQGLTMAMSGFGNTALTLVAAALFLAAAMTVTGLDQRIALLILSRVGTRTNRIVIGAIVVATVMALRSAIVPRACQRAPT